MSAPTPSPGFLFPQEVVRDEGSSATVGQRLAARLVPAGAVAIIADTVIHDLAMTTGLIDGLRSAGFTPEVFSGVAGEPDLAMLERAVEFAASVDAVAYVGIGGGSALDTAKIVAYATATATPVRQVRGVLGRVPDLPPLVLVPTTVGTGSEATAVAMYSDAGVKTAVVSPQLIPDLVVLDPALVADLPPAVVASTALDALAHAIESMLSTRSSDLSRAFAGQAAQTIFTRLLEAFGGDRQARSDLQHASFLAGVSLNSGVVLGHSISYALAERHPMAHGVGCAIALPYCLAYNQSIDDAVAGQIARAALGRAGATLADLANEVERLTDAVQLPTGLQAYESQPQDAATLAHRVLDSYPRPNNPVPFDGDRLTVLLSHLQVGNLDGAWRAMGQTR